MKPILEFSAIFAVGILNHLLGAYYNSKRSDYLKSFTITENLLRYWGGSIAEILVVLLVAIDQPGGFNSIGIRIGEDNSKATNIGLLSFSLLIISIAIIQKAASWVRKKAPETKIDRSNPAVINVIQYRDGLELSAYLTTLPFVVVAEDLIYRGYLVLLLGNKTHTYIPWAILSITLSVIIHLYQGRSIANVAYQAIFSAFFIGLTIATGNILAPITAHLLFDIMWTVSTWRKANKSIPQMKIIRSNKAKFAYVVFIGFNCLLFYSLYLAVSMRITIW